METIKHIASLSGVRLDKMLSEITPLSRVRVKELIEEGEVFVNEKIVKANYKTKINDEIIINIPDLVEYNLEPIEMSLDIIYEDSDVLVINKPSGLIVHPSTTSHEPTLVNGLLFHIKDLSGINGVMRPGIVHRIDKDTTGLLMIAKNDFAHQALVSQLMDKTTTRKYIALVYGIIDNKKGKIDAPIGRDPKDRVKMCVIDGGKEAVTNFSVIEKYSEYTLVECVLETGRTHQIRVHMKYIGHPIVGDPVYGPKKVIGENGQFLHAKTIGFIHPKTKKYMEFSKEIPEDFKNYLSSLKK